MKRIPSLTYQLLLLLSILISTNILFLNTNLQAFAKTKRSTTTQTYLKDQTNTDSELSSEQIADNTDIQAHKKVSKKKKKKKKRTPQKKAPTIQKRKTGTVRKKKPLPQRKTPRATKTRRTMAYQQTITRKPKTQETEQYLPGVTEEVEEQIPSERQKEPITPTERHHTIPASPITTTPTSAAHLPTTQPIHTHTILPALGSTTRLLPSIPATSTPPMARRIVAEEGERREPTPDGKHIIFAPTATDMSIHNNPHNWFTIPVANRILFYDNKVHPDYFVFSNYYEHATPIIIPDFRGQFANPDQINKNKWITTEQYFQAMKYHVPQLARGVPNPNYEMREKIRTLTSDPRRSAADKSKYLAKNPAGADHIPGARWVGQKIWDSISTGVMLTAVRAKFDQDKAAQQLLLNTGNKVLIEDTYKYDDMIWGAGDSGTGKNLLGQILMHVRKEIRQGHTSPFVVHTPDYFMR